RCEPQSERDRLEMRHSLRTLALTSRLPPFGVVVRCRAREVKESAVPVPVSALRAAEWDLAYRAHGQALLRYLRRFARTQEIAEELMQEAFARAIRTQGPVPSSDAIRPWLYRVATNIAI